MVKAVTARMRGDEYQARVFWWQACGLFHEDMFIERVAYEEDSAKAFDDVGVAYRTGMVDEYGDPLVADHFQVKFHVRSNGALTAAALITPAFINASSVSLLQRIKEAQQRLAADGSGVRLIVYSPWPIDHHDVLGDVHSLDDGRLIWEDLSQGTERSERGKVRTMWREHLGLDHDDELETILRPLRLLHGPTFDYLGRVLNLALPGAGLAPVSADHRGNPYDQLPGKLLREGRTGFTRTDIEDIARREGLWRGLSLPEEPRYKVGIRSFARGTERLQEETDAMLCLIEHFDGRRILSDDLWHSGVFARVATFLDDIIRDHQRIHLQLPALGSVAFAAGYRLETKLGVDVVPIQATAEGPRIWAPHLHDVREYPQWTFTEHLVDGTGDDVALAIAATHHIKADVEDYVTTNLPHVGRIVTVAPPAGSGDRTITDGGHAKEIVDRICDHLKRHRTTSERRRLLHIFSAAPNTLLFYLGQRARVLGRCTLYEYDFDTGAPGAYTPSLSFPPRID